MKFCQKCVSSETNPFITIDSSGICSGCNSFNTRQNVDWGSRQKSFEKIVEHTKKVSSGYDCLIPVSGGKDSYWQVITCLDYGLVPLTVTWKDPMRLPIGQENLNNLINIGVDHIDYSINPEVEKKFLYLSFKKFGVPALPKHMALYNLPLRLAVKFNIPLMVWGENAAIEYGELKDQSKGFDVDYDWLNNERGVTQGTSAEDWIGDDLSRGDLAAYFSPTREELDNSNLRAVYLGHYFEWDQVKNYTKACEYGFSAPKEGPGYYTFDDVDSGFISIHHYMKWYKFGYTRTFDNLSYDIRHGRITRDEALDIIRARIPETPHKDIEEFCKFLDITTEHFYEIAEQFRNTDIWKKAGDIWQIPDFIIEDFHGWSR